MKQMSYAEWATAAEDLAGVTFHLQAAGLVELSARMTTARYLLEDQRNPAAAAAKLSEVAHILYKGDELSVRLAGYEQGRSRHPKVLVRLSSLASAWAAYRSVDRSFVPTLAPARAASSP